MQVFQFLHSVPLLTLRPSAWCNFICVFVLMEHLPILDIIKGTTKEGLQLFLGINCTFKPETSCKKPTGCITPGEPVLWGLIYKGVPFSCLHPIKGEINRLDQMVYKNLFQLKVDLSMNIHPATSQQVSCMTAVINALEIFTTEGLPLLKNSAPDL